MGSLPLPWDVETMVREHNIGAVVNMTAEWAGTYVYAIASTADWDALVL